MGITNFNKLLAKKYPSSIQEYSSKKRYDYALVDTNHIFHSCVSNCDSLKFIKIKLENRIKMLINLLNTSNFIFVTDGPAPYAKLFLQRKRREDMTGDEISTSNLIPGTTLMKNMEEMLVDIVNRIKSEQHYLKLHITFILSDIPGEGESKINSILVKSAPNTTNIIVGNDADIVVMSVARSEIHIDMYNNIFPFKGIINVDDILKNTVSNNFVLTSLFLGNDYIPKLLFTTPDKLWNCLEKFNTPILNYECIKNKNITHQTYADLLLYFQFISTVIPKTRLSFVDVHYDKDLVKNYLDGLFWCLYLYLTGNCLAYDYTFEYKAAPLVQYIIKYISEDIPNFSLQQSDACPIYHKIYPIFVLPYEFVPQEYKKIFKKLNINSNKNLTALDIKKISDIYFENTTF